jgi:hypothetical protein
VETFNRDPGAATGADGRDQAKRPAIKIKQDDVEKRLSIY